MVNDELVIRAANKAHAIAHERLLPKPAEVSRIVLARPVAASAQPSNDWRVTATARECNLPKHLDLTSGKNICLSNCVF
jgi:hypothetical protein